MTAKQKKTRTRIIIAIILYAIVLMFERFGVYDSIAAVIGNILTVGSAPAIASENLVSHVVTFIMFAAVYLYIGYDVIFEAFGGIRRGQVFDENFLMMIATFGAFAVGEYPEAVAVMIFNQIGELFENYAVGRSRQSIQDMMDIVPEYANVEEDGVITQTDPDDVEIGTLIVVKPGERVPLDGVVVEGESMLDTAALTGESVPRKASVGDEIFSGCINGEGILKVRTTKAFDDSTVSRILELVENASDKKAQVENFITRFAKYYTPAVTCAAVLLAIIPPAYTLITAGEVSSDIWFAWLKQACIFLVISCPCALVLSVPMGFFGGIGVASRHGILVKGSNYLEAASHIETVAFDKTGTLTEGKFKVRELYPENVSKGELLELAVLAESFSNHPIAQSIRIAYGDGEADLSRVLDAKEVAGQGVEVKIDGDRVLAGNAKLMNENSIAYKPISEPGTVVYLAQNNEYIGGILIADEIKAGVKEAIKAMKAAGIKKTVMLTGDRREAAEAVAKSLGIDEVHAELFPQDKVEAVEKLLENSSEKSMLAFVGDGINDAPVLMRADVGIAMGAIGSDAAIEAADIVLMDDDVRKIAIAKVLAKRTMTIVYQCIVFALAVKFVVLALGICGVANMWMAIFADVGVSVIAILNAMRTLMFKNNNIS